LLGHDRDRHRHGRLASAARLACLAGIAGSAGLLGLVGRADLARLLGLGTGVVPREPFQGEAAKSQPHGCCEQQPSGTGHLRHDLE